MSQFDFGAIDPSSMSGTELAAALGSFRDALNSHHSGESRPSYVQEGMIWVSKAATPYTAYFFDGTSDIALFTIDPSTHAKTVPDYAPLKSPAFTDNPTGPTRAAKNNTTSLANAAFVQGEKGYAKSWVQLVGNAYAMDGNYLGRLTYFNRTASGDTTVTMLDPTGYGLAIIPCVNVAASKSVVFTTPAGNILYGGAASSTFTLPPGNFVEFISNGTDWIVTRTGLAPLDIADWLAGTSTIEAPISPEKLAATVAALAAPSAGVPIGSVVFMPSVRTPIGGYIAGNGAAISRAAYADLDAFMYVGDDYNAAAPAWYRCTSTSSPSTTRSTTGDYIVLPDFRGVFPRFLDDGRGYDSSRNVNSYQADAFASHSHTAQMYGAGNGSGSGAQARSEGTGGSTLTTSAVGAAETRPKNIAMRGWIKY